MKNNRVQPFVSSCAQLCFSTVGDIGWLCLCVGREGERNNVFFHASRQLLDWRSRNQQIIDLKTGVRGGMKTNRISSRSMRKVNKIVSLSSSLMANHHLNISSSPNHFEYAHLFPVKKEISSSSSFPSCCCRALRQIEEKWWWTVGLNSDFFFSSLSFFRFCLHSSPQASLASNPPRVIHLSPCPFCLLSLCVIWSFSSARTGDCYSSRSILHEISSA